MARYRRKPVEVFVSAEQWFAGRGHPDVAVQDVGGGVEVHVLALPYMPVMLFEGDWILTFADGHKERCNPEAFARDYEPVDAEDGDG